MEYNATVMIGAFEYFMQYVWVRYVHMPFTSITEGSFTLITEGSFTSITEVVYLHYGRVILFTSVTEG